MAKAKVYLEKELRVYRTNSVNLDEVDDEVYVYDIGRGMYDHHQPDALKRENDITYSSFGLLWKKFGKDFLQKRDFLYVDALFEGIDKDLVEGIDADDNGIFPKIDAIYKVKTISNIIKIFNPSFDSNETEKEQFIKAVALAKSILEEEILYINGKVIAEAKINDIIEKLDENSKYILLNEYLPYEEAILNNEKAKNILFVAFPSNRGGYAIKVIPKSIEDRTARMSFPEEWAGLDGKELENISQIEGLRFCHTGRFIVSCDTLQAVYQVLDKLCK